MGFCVWCGSSSSSVGLFRTIHIYVAGPAGGGERREPSGGYMWDRIGKEKQEGRKEGGKEGVEQAMLLIPRFQVGMSPCTHIRPQAHTYIYICCLARHVSLLDGSRVSPHPHQSRIPWITVSGSGSGSGSTYTAEHPFQLSVCRPLKSLIVRPTYLYVQSLSSLFHTGRLGSQCLGSCRQVEARKPPPPCKQSNTYLCTRRGIREVEDGIGSKISLL